VPLRIRLGATWHDVTLARRPWRIDQHWWRDRHIQRDYFRVVPHNGPPVTIYHDLIANNWFRQEYR
jgi:hypothetical protein